MLIAILVFLLGICTLQVLPDLSILSFVYLATIIVGTITYFFPKLKLFFIYFLGLSFMYYQVNLQLTKIYPYEAQLKPITVVGTIASLPHYKPDIVKFDFKIQQILDPEQTDIDLGLVKLSWRTDRIIRIGDKWQLTLRLKRPRGFANPGGLNLEKQYFAKRIIATGYVDLKQAQQKISTNRLLTLRQYLNDNITKVLKDYRFKGAVLAITLGMQKKIGANQWQVLRKTGTAHLFVISGLHISFVAGVVFLLAAFCWRRMPVSYLVIPAPWVGALSAVLAAFGYALLAGFSVPTQRACIMVVAVMLGILIRRVITPVRAFSWALLIVLLLDPFVTLTLSFWLSFFVVGILLYAFTGRLRTASKFERWIKPQLVVFIGMLPLLIVGFGEASIIAPIANIIAIPWVGFLVVPFSLLGTLVYPLWHSLGANLWVFADFLLCALWVVLEFLQQLPWASWQPVLQKPWHIVFTFIGVLWLLAPRGIPGRFFGILGFLPLLFPVTYKIPYGEIKFTLLDVGQGLASVIETKDHIMLYDTGPKFSDDFNAGEHIIYPFLRHVGIKKIDKLVISHADLDHSGGFESLLEHFTPKQILTSLPERLNAKREGILKCKAGQYWEWDGVYFEFLHPSRDVVKKFNEQSCVLKITTATHSVLLTGDIGKKTEHELIARYGERLKSDILVVPHHGSRTSSSAEFIKTVSPEYALFSFGYLNRYGHPKPQVVARYKKEGVRLINTVECGAILFDLGENDNYEPNCYRRDYWWGY